MTSILVVCAHSDDQVLGPGGTLLKYAKEGAKIRTIILSHGIGSHPHFKPEVIRKIRIQEAEKADKRLGGKGVSFLGVIEGQFLKDRDVVLAALSKAFKQFKPDIIFTHSPDDPHKDHRQVNEAVLEAFDKERLKADVFAFDVWTFWNLKKRSLPKMVVDISDEFDEKLKLIDIFKSQRFILLALLWSVYFKAFLNGLKYHVKKAEVFYKVR